MTVLTDFLPPASLPSTSSVAVKKTPKITSLVSLTRPAKRRHEGGGKLNTAVISSFFSKRTHIAAVQTPIDIDLSSDDTSEITPACISANPTPPGIMAIPTSTYVFDSMSDINLHDSQKRKSPTRVALKVNPLTNFDNFAYHTKRGLNNIFMLHQ